MRLEKLITTNPISDFFTETFDLLSAGQFENLVFRPQSQGGQISGSPELVGTLPQAPFFSTKKGPIFLGTDPPDLGTDHEGTARKSAASRKGGTGVFLTRHGTSESSESPESERL